jgi:hypothetical protein
LGSAWFSGEEDKKGSVEVGRLADLAVLSADYFSVPEDEIKRIESVLTVLGGKVVYAAGDFEKMSPPALPVSPDWSPVKEYRGYHLGQVTPPAHGRLAQFGGMTCDASNVLACDCFAY